MKKRIAFIVTKSDIGGAQKWVKEQVEILSKSFDVYLATNEDGWLTKNCNVISKLIDKRIESRCSLTFLFNFKKFIKENEVDLVVASSANAGLYARLLKLLTKAKVCYVSHGWSAVYNGGKIAFIFKFIERLLSFLSDGILCISQKDEQIAKNIIRIREAKIDTISNKLLSMPTERLNPKQGECFSLLSVARFVHPKRLDLLIEAVKQLPNVQLKIVGYGEQENDLKSISDDSVEFLGRINGFDRFLDYDAFALISDSEGLPMTAIEAMSAGLPLILSDVGGCSELIDENGALVENNIVSIMAGIQKVVGNREYMASASLKLFQDRFDLEMYQNDYVEYYDRVISN